MKKCLMLSLPSFAVQHKFCDHYQVFVPTDRTYQAEHEEDFATVAFNRYIGN